MIVAFVASAGVLLVLGTGLWILGALVTSDYATTIALGVAWFVIVGAIVWRVSRRRSEIRRPARATFTIIVAVSAVGFYWTSIRDERVNEQVVTGVAASQPAVAPRDRVAPGPAPANVELARGGFVSRAHATRGTATVVALAGGGRRLTLTDFATDNGPDLRVYLVRGPVRGDGDVDNGVDLGRLKGNIGNQQYTVPDGVDVAARATVVIWCRAFSVSFAQADLLAS